MWDTPSNWDTDLIPIASSQVTIDTNVSAPPMYIDTTGTRISSLTIGVGTDLTEIGTGLSGSLEVDGSLINSKATALTLSLPVSIGASAVWSGPLNFTSSFSTFGVDTLARTVTFSGAASFASVIALEIDSASTNSALNVSTGSITYSGATIKIYANGGYIPVAGNSWDFTNSNFAGATFDLSNITLGPGLSWDTSNFLTTGVLTVVVPEPTTWALLAGSLTTVMVFRRRRTNA